MGRYGAVRAEHLPRHAAPARMEPDPLREYADMMLPSEVAAVFGVGVKTVSRWDREGLIKATRTLGGHRRFPKDEVRRVLLERLR